MRYLIIILNLFLFSNASHAQLAPEFFPVDASLRVRVEFWKKVYTQISSQEAFLHDSDDLSIIYKKISYPGMTPRNKSHFADRQKKEIQQILRAIVSKNRVNLSPPEAEIFEKVKNKSNAEISAMVGRIRKQQGMSDRYYEGLVRSFPYLERMKQIFLAEKLPPELVFLPHVESSFNYKAYSKVGAAGMWQFMRSTARTYGMKMNYLMDERRDPIVSTKAAARFLRNNYEKLGSWPLALTAYNHGPKSMDRAVQKFSTKELSKIIDSYQNRRFGFASKNFYATFVATAEISQSPEKYFPNFARNNLPSFSEINLRQRMSMDQIARVTGYSKDDLQDFNLALRPAVFRSNFYLPKNFTIRVPTVSEVRMQEFEEKFALLTKETTSTVAAKIPSSSSGEIEHAVKRGESLYTIAKLYNVNITDLIYVNNISRPSQIQPGVKLKIPEAGKRVAKENPIFVAEEKAPPNKETVIEEASENKFATLLTSNEDILNKEMRTIAPEPLLNDEFSKEAEIKEPEISNKEDIVSVTTSAVKDWVTTIKDKIFGEPKVEKAEDLNALAAKEKDTVAQKDKRVDFDPSAYNFDIEKVNNSTYQIYVEVDETLGHYAEWAAVNPAQLRRLNHINNNIRQGQKFLVPLTDENLMRFNLQRISYHQAIEEDLFTSYKVTGTADYKIQRGDTVAGICKDLEIPFWLLRKYQPHISETKLAVGEMIKVPVLVPLKESDELPKEDI